VRSGPGAARTILRFHIIRARPSKEPRMVGSTLGVYSFALIFVSARTNKRHHHHHHAILCAPSSTRYGFALDSPGFAVDALALDELALDEPQTPAFWRLSGLALAAAVGGGGGRGRVAQASEHVGMQAGEEEWGRTSRAAET
jgi:hypothetical protein